MSRAVKIEHLSIVLDHDFTVIDDVSVDIAAGSITGIIGPSGAGKTTLIRTIVGRQHVSHGSVEVFGQPAGSAALRRQISYMTQAPSIYPDLSVRENLNYFAAMFGIGRAHRAEAITKIIDTVQLAPQADQRIAHLSGGQKQRVSLAIALIGEPRLMVLDEPTVGLDPVLREQLWQLFETLAAAGTTIIISSHAMDEAERCADLLLIRDGVVLAHDSPAGLKRNTHTKTIEQAFIALVGAHPAAEVTA